MKVEWLEVKPTTSQLLFHAIHTQAHTHKDFQIYVCMIDNLCACMIFLQGFRERVLPNIQQLVSADYIRSVHESGADLRTHLINTREYLCQEFGFNV